jgi:hypothetical protein
MTNTATSEKTNVKNVIIKNIRLVKKPRKKDNPKAKFKRIDDL